MQHGSVDPQGRDTSTSSRREPVAPGEVALVCVRAEVMAEAEHAFGNLFHRLHYLAQKLQSRGVDGAASLAGSLAELEDLLRLVLEYASPLSVDARWLSVDTVLGGVETGLSRRLAVRSGEMNGAQVLADAAQMVAALAHLRRVLGDGPPLAASLELEEGSCWLAVGGLEPGRPLLASGRALVSWALAQKLIEAQGGTLAERTEDGGARWALRLPLAGER
jgi:hypothetical protein